ncbi:hypothetical protein SCATT_p13690 (plasmid) [Streptantibioticus cattleyicolor NRRL 8057 = DSM 46488]|uniref:Uncharacterized protein n=1 Tax=Streptantibioticus cattleyicolor (strain ATCC 35852 / DSM 46488 / JCM 4925 / NBRC 14057 / NRRL 8057) TaxID=1003195 RepID=G8XG31_STREN|nr:hypothetical protein SCATT_p13690 [Streptantibioticus cattleyicolor NRRL 8057 = DSM 46488]
MARPGTTGARPGAAGPRGVRSRSPGEHGARFVDGTFARTDRMVDDVY